MDEGNIYEYNARSVLALYGDFAEAQPSCTLAAISLSPLPAKARAALEASAQKLGYGTSSIAWLWLQAPPGTSSAGVKLGPTDLYTLVEGLDPLGIIACDIAAVSELSKAAHHQLKVNEVNRLMGRDVIAFGDFPMMLEDYDAKQRAWHMLKALKR